MQLLIFSEVLRKIRGSTPYRAGRAGESVYEFLKRTFEEQKAEFQERDLESILEPRWVDEFLTMASEMEARGFFKSFD